MHHQLLSEFNTGITDCKWHTNILLINACLLSAGPGRIIAGKNCLNSWAIIQDSTVTHFIVTHMYIRSLEGKLFPSNILSCVRYVVIDIVYWYVNNLNLFKILKHTKINYMAKYICAVKYVSMYRKKIWHI